MLWGLRMWSLPFLSPDRPALVKRFPHYLVEFGCGEAADLPCMIGSYQGRLVPYLLGRDLPAWGAPSPLLEVEPEGLHGLPADERVVAAILALGDLGLHVDVDWYDAPFEVLPHVAVPEPRQGSNLNPPRASMEMMTFPLRSATSIIRASSSGLGALSS
jgi:hypothetical protein